MSTELLRWWIVTSREYSGYECNGHDIAHLVAAADAEQAKRQVWHAQDGSEQGCVSLDALPSLQRRRKPFVLF
jgi:hypothetical protein